ncbi:uncharacterized protein LOC110458936 isoform X2 [Mizuhopecten yessoensis]|uniref:uncharacterized protein LOC110458936 isoform X2 n=1 Tax=Mizuhopecten yessoensis TaxID=6573 RepID=UPI000B45E678|nr:uncharacterized protein LOC110458936 isoform X2 [Mizuhopecten yessoensis]
MATNYQSSKETTNFARICRLVIDVIPDLLRDLLNTRLPASGLSAVLTTQKRKIFSVLLRHQKNILYPQGGVYEGSVKDLDTSLLYILLRNIGNIPSHQKSWGNAPNIADRSLSANIDRLREQRNEVFAHAPNTSLSDGDFQASWDIIRQSVEEIQNSELNTGRFVVAVDEILTMEMDHRMTNKYIEALLLDIKDDLKKDVGAVKEDVGAVKEDVGAVKEDVGAVKEDVGAVKKDVGVVKKDVGDVKEDVGAVKEDVGAMKEDVATVRADVSSMKDKLNTLSTGTSLKKETTTAMILKEKDEYEFLSTKSLHDAYDKLKKNSLVIIKGNSGDGKTSIALELLRRLCYNKEGQQCRQPLELHDIKDLDNVTRKSQLVIYLDYIFGKNVVCKQDVEEWEKREKSIISKLCGNEHTEGNFLIITIRSGISNSLTGSCLEKVFTKQNIVDLNIDVEEKLELLRLYKPKDNFDSWKDDEEKEIVKCAPDIGFPQCCRLFRDSSTLQAERVNFFKRPFHFLKSSLSKLEDGKCYGLMYLFLNGGKVMEDDLDSNNENIDENLLKAAFANGIVKVTTTAELVHNRSKGRKIEFVKDSLDCLLGWMVKKESNQNQKVCYKFNHDSIEETLALLYGEKTPIGYIQNCPRKFLSYVTTSKTTPNKVVISSGNQYNAMYKRLLGEFESLYTRYSDQERDWFYSKYHSLTSLDVWIDIKFLQGFIRWLRGQNVDKNLCHVIMLALLNAACSSGSEECVLSLLSDGVTPDKQTPLYVVAGESKKVLVKIVKYLNDRKKLFLLNKACSSGSEECVLSLLSDGVTPDKQTPLYVVAGESKKVLVKIVKYLNDRKKLFLLNKACSSGPAECALFLLSVGVTPDEETPFCVVEGGSVSVLRKLLEYDVTQTARAYRSRSPHYTSNINILQEAGLFEREEMVTMLCNTYPHLVHDTDIWGQSTLHLVAQTENCDIFKTVERVILKSLYRVEDKQHKCETVGGRVVHRNCVCAQYMCLLVSNSGETVLHYSCKFGHMEVCKYLWESYPALTTAVNNNDLHCLHFIAWFTSDVDLFTECESHVKQHIESTGGKYDITTILTNRRESVLDVAKYRGTENKALYDLLVQLFGQQKH